MFFICGENSTYGFCSQPTKEEHKHAIELFLRSCAEIDRFALQMLMGDFRRMMAVENDGRVIVCHSQGCNIAMSILFPRCGCTK
jgi:hypothetical protein